MNVCPFILWFFVLWLEEVLLWEDEALVWSLHNIVSAIVTLTINYRIMVVCVMEM